MNSHADTGDWAEMDDFGMSGDTVDTVDHRLEKSVQ